MSDDRTCESTNTAKPPAFIDARRRGLLQGAAVAVAGGAAGVGTAARAAAAPLDPVAAKPAEDAGYRLTDHVREYYAKARS